MCDIIDVIKDPKFDESIRIRAPGERGAVFSLRKHNIYNIYTPSESKSTAKEIQRKFGQVAVDVQKYKRQEVVLMGDSI